MPQAPRTPPDTTIHTGLRLYDGTDYDTVVDRVEYGGFGVIAFGPNTLRDGQMVAYKTLRRDLLSDQQTHGAFVRECLLWIGMWGHANIAEAYAVLAMGDAINQRPFLALAFARYGSVRTLLETAHRRADGRLPLNFGLDLAQQIAAGLAYLHQPDPAYLRHEPTVHRDLKPENVLIMEDGRAVITDFGLAKAVEESPLALALLLSQRGLSQGATPGRQAEEAILVGGEEATQTTGLHTTAGVALGTIPYMPPEQWEDARHAGTPADIYALGIMLSEILAGRHALLDLGQPHSQAEWRRAHAHPQPRLIREVAPDVPAEVEAIYRRCLARDPEDRPTAAEVLVALQAGARAAGLEAYTPPELVRHTPYNEWVHWHQWGNAYYRFDAYEKALACSDRALDRARQLRGERADLLPATLMTRGAILKELGTRALARGDAADGAKWDRRAEEAFQEALATSLPVTTPEGQKERASIWHNIGVFNNQRRRFAHAEDAYVRALAIKPDKANTYFNRAINYSEWGLTEVEAGRVAEGIAHVRQARVHAVTAIGMGHATALTLLQTIEGTLQRLGVSDDE